MIVPGINEVYSLGRIGPDSFCYCSGGFLITITVYSMQVCTVYPLEPEIFNKSFLFIDMGEVHKNNGRFHRIGLFHYHKNNNLISSYFHNHSILLSIF